MARLLKSVYFQTSYSKLYSYSTKANPYVEVLRTLKCFEQDLRNKSKIVSPYKESANVSDDQQLLRKSVPFDEKRTYYEKNKRVQSQEKKIILHKTEKVENRTEAIDLTQDRVSKSEVVENKLNSNQNKNHFYIKKETNESGTRHSNPASIPVSTDKKLNKPPGAFSQQVTDFVTNPNDLKDRTCEHKSESQNSGKKKLKTSPTKPSRLFGGPSEYVSNLNPKEGVKSSASLKKSKDKNAKKKVCDTKASQDGKQSKSSKAKAKAQMSKEKEDKKKKIKHDQAMQNLKLSMQACINVNEINKVQKTFEYLSMDEKNKEYVDVNLYNTVISGWAREGRLDKVKRLFLQMTNQNLVPNLQTYASYLEAVSRSKCVDVAEIPKIVDQMKMQGYTAKDLLQKCVFIGDQREKVMEALGFVERDLSLSLHVPEKPYDYKLLEKLNDKDYEREEGHFNFGFEEKVIPKLSHDQIEVESRSTIKVKSVNVAEVDDKVTNCRNYIKECENMWRKRLTKVINGLKTPKNNNGSLCLKKNQPIYPYLSVIDTEIIVNLLLQEIRFLGETAEFYSPNIKLLYRDLGVKIMRHYFMALNKRNKVTDKVHFIYQKYLSYLLDPDLYARYSPREYWDFLKSKYLDGPTIDVSEASWPYGLLTYFGSILYHVLISNIGFNPNRITRKSDGNFMYPAFHMVYEHIDVKLSRQIRAHDMFSKLYRDAKLDYLEFDVCLVPMLTPPRPWIKYDSGGLLITKIPFIRFPEQARSLSSFYDKVPAHQLNPCFDSLNNLSLCPWIINKPLLDIVIKIFQDGGSEELDIPLDPTKFHLDTKAVEESSGNEKKLFKLRKEYTKDKCEMTSLWFDCLYKLSIANHFRDKVFWFPHNLDFRGRVYPTPPHFNHLGSDLSRSILLFAEGKPLGEKGLDWLKIHAINLTGFKKRAPHRERLEYANEILPEILDSADNPFGENKWWTKSDKPLQTLACCKEIAQAVRHPNPKEYISHFPVHQDGSCNGLQHYAALGRDELGAIEVNLHPSDSPQDVYSGVASLVEKERERDAKAGVEIAEALKGFVTRKVVKQTVMTFVYGVTPYGARLQVLKQLKDLPDFPEKYNHQAATYLMKKIFLSIKEMFTATKKIQDWFTYCAEEITRGTDDAVEWITPLGLPVIQPYYKETVVRSSQFCPSKGNKENINHYISHFEPYQLPNIRKQKNAFAPNFIHSLDSTHMMLTSLFCHRKCVTFVSVHDCYWTHASSVKVMNKICREQFVSLHSEPILENLSEFFLQRFASEPISNMDLSLTQKEIKAKTRLREVLKAVPDKGTFDLKQVLNSEYFFS